MTKPYANRNVKRAKWQHKNIIKKFDYTAITDQLRAVNWSNYSNPTSVVNRFTGQTFPLPATVVWAKLYENHLI